MALDLIASAAAAAAAADAPPALAAAAPPTPARLSTEQRYAIVALTKHGCAQRSIAKEVQCSVSAVKRCMRRYREYGSPLSGSRSGRPRATTTEEDENIAITARLERFTSARQVCRQLDLGVHPRTVDRRLQEAGLLGRVAQHKRAYGALEVRARLSFADGYKSWTPDQWSRVLYSDEKSFYGKGFCGRTWVRREPGTAFSPEHCVNKTAHPVKVNAWGCFSAAGPGYIHIFYDNLDSAAYLSILRSNLIDVAQRDFAVAPPAIASWHFLQDNAPMHKAIIVRDWLHTAGISVLDFPAYSPDLNPIENLWAIMGREVEKMQCDDVDSLGDAVLKVWNELSPTIFSNLSRSMPARCQAVIAAHGQHTKY